MMIRKDYKNSQSQLLYLNFLTLRYTLSFCCSSAFFAREKVQATIHFVPGPSLKPDSSIAKMPSFQIACLPDINLERLPFSACHMLLPIVHLPELTRPA
jgi:hypothetical protein